MSERRKLVAALACRNSGSRLYGKPLQNLDVKSGYRIIDNVISCLQRIPVIDEVVLAVSTGSENQIFEEIANDHKIKFITGDEQDVLARLISAGEFSSATDIFRITSESPFIYFETIAEAWKKYVKENLDALFLEPIVDGCGFEILSLNALRLSHINGTERHRSEMCSLYLRENADKFIIHRMEPPKNLQRFDLRLTVDNPEDLVVCRHIFKALSELSPMIPLDEIILFLDRNPGLIAMVAPFAEVGYQTMYL